jgi:hypothetical protein
MRRKGECSSEELRAGLGSVRNRGRLVRRYIWHLAKKWNKILMSHNTSIMSADMDIAFK